MHTYIQAIEKNLVAGNATEHTHRPALKNLIEGLSEGATATNEPTHIECGAPDFVITKGVTTIGYIEAKDVGKNLDEAEKSEQLKRYRDSLTNLILTDYLEFRWYVDGERKLSACLGSPAKDGKVKHDKAGIEAVAELIGNFLAHEAEGVGTPKELARHMARLAHRIREGVEESLVKGLASDLLSGLYKAFQETLIPGLKVNVFADMYSQTIAYGLFAARCETDNASAFSRQQAASLIPKTNPFLRDLFHQVTGPTLDDEPYKWAVDELVQLLKKAEMAEILKDFGKGTGKDDPVVYFYEDFLREYDKKISQMRGVYYTPIPVVSYIVRSIDHLLKTNFNRPQGLADKDTYILDPATGTGTFLYAVINEIHESMNKQGQMGQWDGYVAAHLLPRIFGFELLMTPYVIAHLKLGLQLKDTGIRFQAIKRLGVYLTNTLEEAVKSTEMLMAHYIVKEANAAAEIKKDAPIMVVLGNPPYSVSSLNRGEWIDTLLADYKKNLNEKKLNIDDDYIKFIRFAQWRIEKTGYGILGFITNNSYLDGLTHRRMREYLLESFSSIYILNLHGSSRRGEQAPDNIKDENVFDIQQGVAIGLFIKEPENTGKRHVHYADMWGLRENKYKALFESGLESTSWQELMPTAPYFFFVPKDFSLEDEYEQALSVKEIFTIWQSALNTDRDELFLDSDRNELKERIQLFFSKNYGDDFKERYRVYPSSSYDIEARRDKTKFADTNIHRCLHRPFDECVIYYDPQLTSRPVYEVMRHMLQTNIALISARQTKEDFAALATSNLCTHKIVTVYDRSFVFPLYLYPAENEMQFEKGHRRPNLNPEFIKAFSEKLGLMFIEDGKGDLKDTFGPEDIFNYAYAIFHSPTYRTRYAEFLKIDFPRLPLTSDKELFKALMAKGAELVALHLMESPVLNNFITKYNVGGSNVVEKVRYDDKTQRVYINKEQYFEGITTEVWNFHIGGYQVCEKWLKDRQKVKRKLTYDELTHYQKVVVALKETIRLMGEIDQVIPGWPLE
ncbi:MAG: N-6 DNA methylase [Chloroflexi bacterium]|nr:N-6 DNA methylase [Chloroflexota bacterium]